MKKKKNIDLDCYKIFLSTNLFRDTYYRMCKKILVGWETWGILIEGKSQPSLKWKLLKKSQYFDQQAIGAGWTD